MNEQEMLNQAQVTPPTAGQGDTNAPATPPPAAPTLEEFADVLNRGDAEIIKAMEAKKIPTDIVEKFEQERRNNPDYRVEAKKTGTVATTPAVKPTEVKPDDELSRFKKQLEDKEAMIQRQAAELGELRKGKTVPQHEESTIDPYEVLTDPAKLEAMVKAKVEKTLAEQQAAREQLTAAQTQTRDFIVKSVPDFEKLIPVIAEIFKSEGESAEEIAKFQANPYAYNGAFLAQVGKRAQAEQALAQVQHKMSAEQTAKERLAQSLGERARTQPRSLGAGVPSIPVSAEGSVNLTEIHERGGDVAIIELVERKQVPWSEVDRWMNNRKTA